MSSGRTPGVLVVLLPLLLLAGTLAACGGDEAADDVDTVTLVGQKFTEADVTTELYRQLLDQAGFRTRVEDVGARDLYLTPLEQGEVQVAADHLSSTVETLNRRVHGADAAPVASPEAAATLAQLRTLAEEQGITALTPARAAGSIAYAVTREYAARHRLETLSDLGRLGRPVALAGDEECAELEECAKGLERVYGITLGRVEPLGYDSPDSKDAVRRGVAQVAQVSATDGSLDGLVTLADDRHWQHAENVLPLVNSAWLADHPSARKALDPLAAVLTTADLAAMNRKVDREHLPAEDVAQEYLQQKGLV